MRTPPASRQTPTTPLRITVCGLPVPERLNEIADFLKTQRDARGRIARLWHGGGEFRWATKQDARVTRVGRFIRKTRIDEIPQIFNVLTGDMSFVGPRPERPAIVADLEDKIAFFKYRHVVKPGITGWAQVNYPYGASIEDAREKLKYDLYYIKNESIFLDFLILMETVRVIFWPDGAR